MAESSKLKAEGPKQSAGLLVLLLVVLTLYFLKGAFNNGTTAREGSCEDKAYVQVEGDVRYPGVYLFCQDGGLAVLIEKAGGLEQPDYGPAAFDDIPLETGVKVTIKRDAGVWRISRDGTPAFYRITLGIPISLNSESEEGLTAIPGVGPKLAGAIVAERGKRGGFKDLSEIREVYGIGDKMYEKIVSYVEL
jgi:competence protein ComEA